MSAKILVCLGRSSDKNRWYSFEEKCHYTTIGVDHFGDGETFGDLKFDMQEPHDRKYVSVYLATFFIIWGEDASYFLSSLTLCTLIRMYRLAFNPISCVGDRIPVHLLTDFFYHVHFASHFYTRDGSLGILTG